MASGPYVAVMEASPTAGQLIRDWRIRRRKSQLELALAADVSSRHVSFMETGRSRPSRQMILHLAEHLDIPLRERNGLLVAAGFAPVFPERPLNDAALAAARRAIEAVLRGHEPFPALAVDGHWQMLLANDAARRLFAAVDPVLLDGPINVLRVSLHPRGLAPMIRNLAVWRGHVLARLAHQIDATRDPVLAALYGELAALPSPAPADSELSRREMPLSDADFVVPLELELGGATLSLISTTTVFGTPRDITLAELAIEAFYPADERSAELLRALQTPQKAPD